MPRPLLKVVTFSVLFGTLCVNAEMVSVSKATTEISVTVEMPQPDEPVPSEWKEQFSFPDDYIISTESDFDLDGIPDYLEYYAGTNPIQGSSRLKIADTRVDVEDTVTSWFSSSSSDPEARKYVLFRSGEGNLADLVNATSIDELRDHPAIIELGPVDAADPGEITEYRDEGVVDLLPLFYRVFLSHPLPPSDSE